MNFKGMFVSQLMRQSWIPLPAVVVPQILQADIA